MRASLLIVAVAVSAVIEVNTDLCPAIGGSAGWYQTCVLIQSNGTNHIKCFGERPYLARIPEVGFEKQSELMPSIRLDPTDGLYPVATCSGETFTCVLMNDRKSLRCFGDATYGELGMESTDPFGYIPAPTTDGDPVRFTLGYGSPGASALDASRTVKLGNSTGLIRKVACGRTHTCVWFDTNRVKCFGYNEFGQLGTEDFINHGNATGTMGDSLPYVKLPPGILIKNLVSGAYHACVHVDVLPTSPILTTQNSTDPLANQTNRVYCWGYGVHGRLGTGDTAWVGGTPRSMGLSMQPVKLPPQLTPERVFAGSRNVWAVMSDGKLYGVGYNLGGILGLGTNTDVVQGHNSTTVYGNLQPTDLGTDVVVQDLQFHVNGVCAVTTQGRMKCWGQGFIGQDMKLGYDFDFVGEAPGEMGDNLPYVDLPGSGKVVKAFAHGGYHLCALLEGADKLFCMGELPEANGMRFNLAFSCDLLPEAPLNPVDVSTSLPPSSSSNAAAAAAGSSSGAIGNSSSNMSSHKIIGLSVGVTVGSVTLLVAGLLLAKRFRRNRWSMDNNGQHGTDHSMPGAASRADHQQNLGSADADAVDALQSKKQHTDVESARHDERNSHFRIGTTNLTDWDSGYSEARSSTFTKTLENSTAIRSTNNPSAMGNAAAGRVALARDCAPASSSQVPVSVALLSTTTVPVGGSEAQTNVYCFNTPQSGNDSTDQDPSHTVAVDHTASNVNSLGAVYSATNATEDAMSVITGFLQMSTDQGDGGLQGEATSINTALTNLRVHIDDIEVVSRIGRGDTFTVDKGRWQGRDIAVKMLSKKLLGDLDARERAAELLRLEALIMSQLYHPNIARVYGLVDSPPNLAVLMPLYSRGSIARSIATPQYDSLTLATRLGLGLQVARGVKFMHEKKPMPLLHLDLTCSNLLLDMTSTGTLSVVISDFSASAEYITHIMKAGAASGTPGSSVGAQSRPASTPPDMPNFAPSYLSSSSASITPPEVLLNNGTAHVSPAADVFAFGICLLEIVTGRSAWKDYNNDNDRIREAIRADNRPEIPDNVPQGVADLIRSCWSASPEDRPAIRLVEGVLDSCLSQLSE